MEISWLKDFEALATLRNFSRAAEDRNVSQPAFSRRIRILEEEVGAGLIDRRSLPLSLTPAGEIFLAQARLMTRTYEETIERCQAVDAANADTIRFATTQSLYLTHYRSLIGPMADHDGVDIDLNSTSWATDQFVTALQQHYCDVILTYWHPAMEALSPLDVTRADHLVLSRDMLLPVAHALPDGRPAYTLPASSKKPVPMFHYGSSSALKPVVDAILRRHMMPGNLLTISHGGQAHGIKEMVQENFGLGWLPREVCTRELDAGSLAIAGNDSFAAPLEIRIYKDAQNQKPSLRKLWRRLEELVAN
ncbi:DNA-binding transcriptional regulator, LysR family [Monaibacterium marinum]|uniref:DNA-binding transcriptional regulator, LysR family n=1 Tax=Pontivivens marinum TaxID=1690039 RepID=A0A2C9CPS7_9RHOB|nr:LysR family transcriptional regulator [Monaibacterium marinum]SOH93252.1 DNA-binding transcriptional regulator, LysR family [Monaibacterium marinum]